MDSQYVGTYRIVAVDLFLLYCLAVAQGWDHASTFLRVTTDAYVNPTCPLNNEGHQVEEGWVDV